MCAICKESGELLLCDTCNLVYHMSCLDPPLTAVPPGMWLCPKCKVRDTGHGWKIIVIKLYMYVSFVQSWHLMIENSWEHSSQGVFSRVMQLSCYPRGLPYDNVRNAC